MLHLLRHSPHSDSRFTSCLGVVAPGQDLVLLEDAVYALLPGTAHGESLERLPFAIKVHAMESDLLGRGLALDALAERVQVIDYARLVDLCAAHEKVLSW